MIPDRVGIKPHLFRSCLAGFRGHVETTVRPRESGEDAAFFSDRHAVLGDDLNQTVIEHDVVAASLTSTTGALV